MWNSGSLSKVVEVHPKILHNTLIIMSVDFYDSMWDILKECSIFKHLNIDSPTFLPMAGKLIKIGYSAKIDHCWWKYHLIIVSGFKYENLFKFEYNTISLMFFIGFKAVFIEDSTKCDGNIQEMLIK